MYVGLKGGVFLQLFGASNLSLLILLVDQLTPL